MSKPFGEKVCDLYDYLESVETDPEEAYWIMDCAMHVLIRNGLDPRGELAEEEPI